MYDFWQKQEMGKPLFPDIIWEKPERKDQAGKLLIIGGSSLGIHDVAQGYEAAREAGIGESIVLLPETLRTATKHLPGVNYLPATPTGNFSLKGRDELLGFASAVDGILIVGGLGRNSETAMLLSDLVRTYSGPLAITKDAIDSLYSETKYLFERPNTLLVASFAQLQRFAKELKSPFAFVAEVDFLVLVEKLHKFTSDKNAVLITKHHDQLLVADHGKIVTTERKDLNELWCVELASKAMTYWLHHPKESFEGIASSLI